MQLTHFLCADGLYRMVSMSQTALSILQDYCFYLRKYLVIILQKPGTNLVSTLHGIGFRTVMHRSCCFHERTVNPADTTIRACGGMRSPPYPRSWAPRSIPCRSTRYGCGALPSFARTLPAFMQTWFEREISLDPDLYQYGGAYLDRVGLLDKIPDTYLSRMSKSVQK